MAEDPEQMLPEDWIAAFGRDEKMGAEVAVHGQFNQAYSYHGEGQDQQERGDEGHPNEHRHAHHRHAWGTHIDDCHHKVQCSSHRRRAQYQKADRPVIQAPVDTEGLFSEVGV